MSYEGDERQPTQWERQVDHLRNIADGLSVDELEVLSLFVAARLRVVRGEPEQVIDSAGLRPLARTEAERLNSEGMRLYRLGHPDFAAFASVATPADTAKRNTDFQRFLGAVVDRAGKPPPTPPTKGSKP